ncbi:protein kinase [Gemmatimonadota bacterium]
MIGKTVGHYQVIDKIGEGGMGVVYRAEDTELKRPVAIKVLPPQIKTSEDEKARFRREAQAAAALNHPNIATVHDLGETDDGQMFIVMELIEGETLSDIISHGALSIDDAIAITKEVAEGLHAAHEAGIVHRDVKPSNIIISKLGSAKILDFGISKIAGAVALTKTSSTLGTAAYMSPEQARGDDVGKESDIWSLGVVLYEMLTGERPFKGEHEAAIANSILNTSFKSVTIINKEISQEIADVISSTLMKDPRARCSSMLALSDDLSRTQSPLGTSSQVGPIHFLRRPTILVPAILGLIIIVATGVWLYQRQERVLWAQQVGIQEIQRLAEIGRYREAYNLAVEVEKIIPDDVVLATLWPKVSVYWTIQSEPSDADVFVRPYTNLDSDWIHLGRTPIDSLRYPRESDRFRVQKAGYVAVERQRRTATSSTVLYEVGSENAEMVQVASSGGSLLPVGLDHLGHEPLNAFLVDRYEVSNKEFKQFVDEDGYENRAYWKHPFVLDGQTMRWEDGIRRFLDRTGQLGPSTWWVQDYPDGKDDCPVSGVSWYEAAAYAEYVGKKLPTVFHWARAAYIPASGQIVPLSNLNSSEPSPRGEYQGLSRYGSFDMAGNVREWVFNRTGDAQQRYILGGGWNDPEYGFTDAFAISAWNRSETNGFRCIIDLEPNDNQETLSRPLAKAFRDYYTEKPVNNDEFAGILRQYAYDWKSLEASIESRDDSAEDWVRERITFKPAYDGERMIAIVFLPKRGQPPYQTVINFPGSGAISRTSSVGLAPSWRGEFILKSGRAFIWPIYTSTYERGDELTNDYGDESVYYKDRVIRWSQDLQRTIDYLETREDIDTEQLAYFGYSWGSANAPIMTVVESRLKASILYVGGLYPVKVLPEADPFNFLPRVQVPTLMLNGRYDYFYPYESTQIPFFNNLGTPDNHKEFYLSEGSHNVPREEVMARSLAWLDRYLGLVK